MHTSQCEAHNDPIQFCPLRIHQGLSTFTMHSTALISSALFAVALAKPHPPTPVIAARQSLTTPPPCEAMDPPPSAAETEERFNEFADAFLVEKNLTHAFAFIAEDYIVRHHLALPSLSAHPSRVSY